MGSEHRGASIQTADVNRRTRTRHDVEAFHRFVLVPQFEFPCTLTSAGHQEGMGVDVFER